MTDGCACWWHADRDPYEPHIPTQYVAEWNPECPVHLPPNGFGRVAVPATEEQPTTCEEAGDRCKGQCTVDTRTGLIKDPDCFRDC